VGPMPVRQPCAPRLLMMFGFVERSRGTRLSDGHRAYAVLKAAMFGQGHSLFTNSWESEKKTSIGSRWTYAHRERGREVCACAKSCYRTWCETFPLIFLRLFLHPHWRGS